MDRAGEQACLLYYRGLLVPLRRLLCDNLGPSLMVLPCGDLPVESPRKGCLARYCLKLVLELHPRLRCPYYVLAHQLQHILCLRNPQRPRPHPRVRRRPRDKG